MARATLFAAACDLLYPHAVHLELFGILAHVDPLPGSILPKVDRPDAAAVGPVPEGALSVEVVRDAHGLDLIVVDRFDLVASRVRE